MTFDFAPLYRSTVGFDHLASLLNNLNKDHSQPSYPPYNIELLEQDKYRITMAVAGFAEDEISVESESHTLTVAATRAQKEDEAKRSYLHQGIAERSFKRQFRLAEHVKVTSATLANGLLHIDLEREIPEAMKPRQIPVNGATAQNPRVLKFA
ncbi:MAG: Hsp20 family protein [Pseudomonadales bacterium]|jgi:molecular chaperone IbpA|nr:Hsp20 family protein [Pseudomonadales bacterium]